MEPKIDTPPEIYQSDLACAQYILGLNQRIAQCNDLLKQLKQQKDVASDVLLNRLEATGQKHFAFEGLGTFAKKKQTRIAFPTVENGGKAAAVEWLKQCLDRGLISVDQLLDIQQARVVADPVLSIEEQVKEYNAAQQLNGTPENCIPESPFNHFDQIVLSSPRTPKA